MSFDVILIENVSAQKNRNKPANGFTPATQLNGENTTKSKSPTIVELLQHMFGYCFIYVADQSEQIENNIFFYIIVQKL